MHATKKQGVHFICLNRTPWVRNAAVFVLPLSQKNTKTPEEKTIVSVLKEKLVVEPSTLASS